MTTPRSKAPPPALAPMPTMYSRHRKNYPHRKEICNHTWMQEPTRENGAVSRTSNLARSF